MLRAQEGGRESNATYVALSLVCRLQRLKKFRESEPIKEIVAYLERPNDAAKSNGHVSVTKIEEDTQPEVREGNRGERGLMERREQSF